MIKAVIFDLYGTIMTSQQGPESKDEALSRILREAGHGVYFQEVWAARQFVGFVDYTRGRADTPQQYYEKVLERLEIPPDPALIDRLVTKDSEIEENLLYPDVAPTIKVLKARDVKTAIVTTIATWRFKPLLEQNNVHIDFVCTAREANAVKPDPRIYTTVLDKFGVSAEETMMVGDDPKTDIEPAKGLGMRTVLINREGRTQYPDADEVISSLTELLPLVIPSVQRHKPYSILEDEKPHSG